MLRVKLMDLHRAAEHVRERHGPQALERVLEACPPSVRERVETGISVEWMDHSELMAFYEVAEQQLGKGDGALAEACGAHAARQDVKGVLKRAMFWMLNPEFVWKRVNHYWHRHASQGGFRVLDLEDGLLRFEVYGVDDESVHRYGCASISGWSVELARAVGWDHARVRHVECRARGAARCVWELRFDVEAR